MTKWVEADGYLTSTGIPAHDTATNTHASKQGDRRKAYVLALGAP
ncbi:MAG TPA: hypothetical protein VI027_03380 [Rubrobacteraceae bacterium]